MHAMRRQRLTGPNREAVLHFWTTWLNIQDAWVKSGRLAGELWDDKLYVMVMIALQEQARQEEQRMTRQATWQEASRAAAIMYGAGVDAGVWRNRVFTVLRSWALTEDEDRWATTLPPCGGDCPPATGEEWSQVFHAVSCPRGRAWRERYKMDAR